MSRRSGISNAVDELLLLIISSPSGAGKTTLTHRLLQQEKAMTFSVSCTTRAPRSNEVDGQDYHFLDEATFRKRIEAGEFAEWAEVHGNLYGTAVSEIDRAKAEGKSVLLFDVDHQGARQIMAKFPEAVSVFILPPSMAELRRRLESRGTETEDSLARRFAKAKTEIAHYASFSYLVVNQDVQHALGELTGIIRAETASSSRRSRAKVAEALLRE